MSVEQADANIDMTTKEILAHPSFGCMENIDDIVNQFFRTAALHFFGHVAVYPDGDYFFLCNKHGWAEEILAHQKLPPAGFVFYEQMKDMVVFPSMDKTNIFGWSDEATRDSRDRFGILNPMMITRKYDDHYEAFVFDLHDRHAYEKYLGCFDVFEQFMHYYKDSSRKLLKQVAQKPLRVPQHYLSPRSGAPVFSANMCEKKAHLSKMPKRYYLKYGSADVVLSAKEYHCLTLLAHGKQLKQIAVELDVSLRTVETYFERLKKKLALSARNELIRVYWKNRILSDQIHGIFS